MFLVCFFSALKQETPDELVLITSFGEVRVTRDKIKELIRIASLDIRNGEYWPSDPNQTRAFVFPTASTLPGGKGFCENYYLLNRAKTVEAAVGGHLIFASGDGESGKAFLPYGVLSLGRPNRGRLNIGAGGVAIEGESAFYLNLSGDVRLARRVKAMGEMFILPGNGEHHVFPIYGLRFFSEKLAFDLGFWNLPGEGGLTAVGTPMVNFVFRF